MAKRQHGGAREGAGRKPANPEGKTVMVAVSVPESLVTSLDAVAEAQELNRSQAVTEAIRRFVKAKTRA